MVISLDRLVNVLGGYGVRSRLGKVPRSTVLRSVVVPEATGDRTVAGDVLLAIGAGSVAEALQWATSARAVAVLVRAGDGADEPVPDAIALLSVDQSVPWSELAAVVYGLVLEARETASGRGPTDLFALADSLAATIGGAVVIEDRLSQVLAYSKLQTDADPARVETILGRRVPARLRARFERDGVFAHLAASDDPLFVAADAGDGLSGRMVVAARVGREVLGSVWVACAKPLRGARRTALTDGARTVTLHLLRSRASADLERQVESDSVLRLLEGSADAGTLASRLGLPHGPLRVIALRPQLRADRHTAPLLAFEAATAGFGWSRPGRSALADNAVYTVMACAEAEPARRWVAALRPSLPEGTTVLAGISGVAEVGELTSARREADECLALHEAGPPGRFPPAYDEAWDDILVHRLRTAAESGRVPQRGPVADLIRHDREHGTAYVATLRAWLEAQGERLRAGEALGVHENTVRNRLRRIVEITGLDLDDAHKRLAMMIELAALPDA